MEEKMHKVLLVDDTKIIHQLVRVYLTGLGCDFDDAYTGQEALDMITSRKYDAVICDLTMPDMDGLTLCREVRTKPEFLHLPFIMLTASNDDGTQEAAAKLGASHFLGKPIEEEALVSTLKRALKID